MKKLVFLASLVATGLMLVFRNTVSLSLCGKREYDCRETYDTLEISLYIFVFVLFFSVITYKAPEKIFTTWWKFTRIALPVILLFTILINLKLHHNPGGWINMDADVDRAAFALMYAIFVIGSLVQIIRGYRQK